MHRSRNSYETAECGNLISVLSTTDKDVGIEWRNMRPPSNCQTLQVPTEN